MKLYHYVHCPYCVRVRMALGFLEQGYQSNILRYDDEKTPIDFTGVKMLPIVQTQDGNFHNESIKIIKLLDKDNKLNTKELDFPAIELEELVNIFGNNVHSLAMPYWSWTPEFDNDSRTYFQSKKEAKRGPFKDLITKKQQFVDNLLRDIDELLNDKLTPFYSSSQLTIYDIALASHLWGMYIVPEFQFPEPIHLYLQRVGKLCNFNYHEDFWK